MQIIEQHAQKQYPFFIVWGQEDCYIHTLRRVYRLDKPNVEAMLKPLLRAWNQCKNICNTKNTLLIDDNPFKGCINPMENCLFPYTFNGQQDDILCNELLPYLLHLKSIEDVRPIISLDRHGQALITNEHKLYRDFQDIIEE